MSNAKLTHQQALIASEQGNFLKALQLEDQATIEYQQQGDQPGFAEIQSMRFITFKHLYRQTKDQVYLILAKHAAISAVELAKHSGIPQAQALPHFNLGKAFDELGEYSQAIAHYQQALRQFELYPNNDHNRPAVIADIKGHLHAAEYRNGDTTAKRRAIHVLHEITNAQGATKYEHDVWVSGHLLRLTEMFVKDELDTAKQYFEQAQKIVTANNELTLRQQQCQELLQRYPQLA